LDGGVYKSRHVFMDVFYLMIKVGTQRRYVPTMIMKP